MKKGDKVYLDGKTACILKATNGILALVSNGEKEIEVFEMRLKKEKYEQNKN